MTRCVETGTAYGEMIDFLKDKFTEIHSIELGQSFYNGAVMRFINNPHIHLHFGDSGQVLGRVLKSIDKPVVFWLDAHYSGGWTAKGSKDTPIMDELAAIYKSGLQHVILIDDSRLFGTDMAYPTRAEVTAFVLGKNPAAVIEWLPEDIIAITPARKPKRVQQYKRSKSCQIPTLSEIYQKEFKGKTSGIFVDVGAYDGHTFSNTWGLAVAGWRGVCFEPVPGYADQCREQYKYYPGVKVIEAAAGSTDWRVHPVSWPMPNDQRRNDGEKRLGLWLRSGANPDGSPCHAEYGIGEGRHPA